MVRISILGRVCSGCHRIIPRQLTPEGLQSLQDPECRPPNLHFSARAKALSPQTLAPSHCVTKIFPQRYWKPSGRHASDQKFMPKNHWGGKERVSDFTAAWSPSLGAANQWKQRLQHLPSSELRAQANNALGMGCARIPANPKKKARTGPSTKSSPNFFRKNPAPEERQLKRHLRFIETEGLECAMWPHVFHQRQQCLTWTRNQSATRIARAAPCRTHKRTNGYQPAT